MLEFMRWQLILYMLSVSVKTMASKVVYILLTIWLSSIECVVNRTGPNIGECNWSGGSSESLTFICYEQLVLDKFFNYNHARKPCLNNRDGYIKDAIGMINFQNCAFSKIPVDIIEFYRYIWKLDLSGVSLKTLGQTDFCGKHDQRLRTLVASHNLLTEIEPNLFDNAQHIRDVDFSFNKIKRIASTAFTNATEMFSLNLSYNNLAKLDDRTFQSLHSLETLILSNNKIEELNMLTFVGLSTLSKLDLSSNLIRNLNAEAFEDLSLNILNVSHNGITELDEKFFTHIHQMQVLDMSGNNISTLNNSFYNSSAMLTELYISNNRIRSINGLATSSFMLTVLDVSRNEISDLCENIFDKFVHLVNINLSFNPIKKLNGLIFSKHSSLVYLNLSQISLTNIEKKTFLKPQKLQFLDLSNNQLKRLDFRIFLPRLRDLKFFYLEGNELKDLFGFRRQLFPSLHTLGIQNNNFNCSYLHSFFDSVVWHELTIEVDRLYPFEVEGDNVGGIRCTKVEESDEWEDGEQNNDPNDQIVEFSPPPAAITNKNAKLILEQVPSGNTTVVLITVIGIVIMATVIFATVMYKNQIMNYFGMDQLSYTQNYSQSSLSINVEPIVFTEMSDKNTDENGAK